MDCYPGRTDQAGGYGWTAFLRSLKSRGLAGVQLVISDAHAGLRAAIEAILIGASWQRCRVHFLRITCWPRCPEARPRWSPPPCAPSSPDPTPNTSASRCLAPAHPGHCRCRGTKTEVVDDEP